MTEQQKQPTTATSQEQHHAARTYRILKGGVDTIERCSYMLPNSLQCWKAGEEEVTTKDATGAKQVYQLCERHVRIQKAIDAGLLKPEHLDTPTKEATTPIPYVPPEAEKTQPAAKEATPPQGEAKKPEGEKEEEHGLGHKQPTSSTQTEEARKQQEAHAKAQEAAKQQPLHKEEEHKK